MSQSFPDCRVSNLSTVSAINPPAPERAMPHKLRMIMRRGRQLARTPGFTPVLNRRLDTAIEVATARWMDAGFDPLFARTQATVDVARTLAPAGIERRLAMIRPSRSDDPAYRAGNR